ncbi:MAG: type I restriction-modification system, S subunit, partial [Candidatus Moranbacteria bacterium GW2011_GWF2_35_39]
QPVGRVVIFNKKDGDFSFSNFTSAIRIKNSRELYFNFLHRFLFFSYISGITEKMQSHSTGIRNLDSKLYKSIEISLPPLPEQHRIVKILDEVFEGIEKAKKNAEKNLKNSKEIFKSYSQNIFENSGKNWEDKKLGEILEIERGGSPRPIQKYLTSEADGINWIKIGDTKNVDKYIFKTNQKIKPEGLKKSRIVNIGDFILSNSMSFGRPYIMKISGAIHDGWLVLREKNKNIIDKDYLYNILGSPYVFNQFDKLAAGSTVRNLNISLVSIVRIPLPQITEQKSIVAKLDALSAETKKLEAIYQQKLADLEELKKSVLKKAFAGEV